MKTPNETFEWKQDKRSNPPINDGDIRIVNLDVKVRFEYSEKIPNDIYYEDGKPIINTFRKGFLMHVMPVSYEYNGEPTEFVGSEFKIK